MASYHQLLTEKIEQGDYINFWQDRAAYSNLISVTWQTYSDLEKWMIEAVARHSQITPYDHENVASLQQRTTAKRKITLYSEPELLSLIWKRFSAEPDFAGDLCPLWKDAATQAPDLYREEDFSIMEKEAMSADEERRLTSNVLLMHTQERILPYVLFNKVDTSGNPFNVYQGRNLISNELATIFVERDPNVRSLLREYFAELKEYERYNVFPKAKYISQQATCSRDKSKQLLIMDDLSFNLKNIIQKKLNKESPKGFPDGPARFTIFRTLKILSKLRIFNIFHGLLRPELIIFSSDGDLRIYFDPKQLLRGHFTNTRIRNCAGCYFPPEVQTDRSIIPSSDPWSICAIAYSLLTLEPFDYPAAMQMIEAASSGNFNSVATKVPLLQPLTERIDLFPGSTSSTEQDLALKLWADFMTMGLNPNVGQRATIDELLSCELFLGMS